MTETTPYAVLRETHAGVVFLVGELAYKLKKPVSLGFLDFGTPERRLAACRREVALNRRLAPDVYLGVTTLSDVDGAEPCVVMRRMPDDRRLSTLVRRDAPLREAITRLARLLAVFHAGAERGPHVDAEGTRDALSDRWEASLAQVDEVGADVLPAATRAEIAARTRTFLAGRAELFASRIAEGRIVDGHGDLLAGDIFVLDDGPRVLDCLEFDDRLRRVDGLDDVAFLAMDLERLGRPDLGALLLDRYAEYSADPAPATLRAHYVAYRAFVRVKVACLRHVQGDHAAADEARAYADLALAHLRRGEVRLVLVGGLPGSGKTTLAGALADELGAVLLSSDRLRKELAGLDPAEHAAAPYRAGIYSPEHTSRVYDELLRRAEELLARGESVVLDASWSAEHERGLAVRVAERTHSTLVPLRCAVPADVAEARLLARTGSLSDATPAVARAMAAEAAPWPAAHTIDTSGDPAASLVAALRAAGGDESPCPHSLSTASAPVVADDDGGMTTMRKQFHERMDRLTGEVQDLLARVEVAMRAATTALFTADHALAESVIAGHADVRAGQAVVDEAALSLLAREQPVAGDLRAIVACLRMSVDVRRMGKLAVHVAEIARDRDPDVPGSVPLWEMVRMMSVRALELVDEAARALATGDGSTAGFLDHDDDRVDRLQRDLYRGLLAGTSGLDAEVVVELALLGRYYERFADHAVTIARDVAYLEGRTVLDPPAENT